MSIPVAGGSAPGSASPDAEYLVAAKRRLGIRVSVCLPARDEADTIGPIVSLIKDALIDAVPVVDEIVVIDDGSTDGTATTASAAGARVVTEADILPEVGPGSGKGNALWKSLCECRGDVVCWLDADVRNFRADYVTRLIAPLLADPHVVLVKAFYDRPLHGEPSGGGRVTELVARPLLSLLFPKIADVIQPLAGEYAGRRDALETLPFVQGWGVELALLIDVVERFGREAIAQCDLGVREHRNRPLDELSLQALAVLATGLRRAGLVEQRDTPFVELLRVAAEGGLQVSPVEMRERPPLCTVPAYRARFPNASRA